MASAAQERIDGSDVKHFSLPALLITTLMLVACVETQPLVRPDSVLDAMPVVKKNDASVQETLRAIAGMQERLDHVAAPLMIKNQDLCRKLSRPLLGFTAKNKYSYSPSLSEAAQEALGLGELLQVTGVMSGSGASRSGLQRGDSLIAAANKPMPKGPNAEYDAPEILAPLIIGQSSIKLTVLRNGKSVAISLPLTRACAFRVELGNTDNVSSYADGRRIMLTRGMIKFARSDDELAYIIAKEMAHNTLGHAYRTGAATVARETINNLMQVYPDQQSAATNIKPMPKEMDTVADRLSIYMLARGGFSLDGVIEFWQRLAQQSEGTANGYNATPTDAAYRIAAMEKSIAEIKAKRSGKNK